ncbi:hypothetical protein NDU88_006261 [Pleurodeles waltl]|uniref:Uncharacterized protein n=1 Tax=Pleurodeles waltl TaxID=8319 RepID=A0AAV7NQ84_PLEWA|nr:hypothetical protein NDU88_006261 [Pleurodeles waltl]
MTALAGTLEMSCCPIQCGEEAGNMAAALSWEDCIGGLQGENADEAFREGRGRHGGVSSRVPFLLRRPGLSNSVAAPVGVKQGVRRSVTDAQDGVEPRRARSARAFPERDGGTAGPVLTPGVGRRVLWRLGLRSGLGASRL